MKTNQLFWKVCLCSLTLFLSCNMYIKRFDGTDYLVEKGQVYKPVFKKQTIFPLKSEWKEFYIFLKKRHLQQIESKNGFDYIYSHQFYKFLKAEILRIYNTPYLQDYDAFVEVFGSPEDIHNYEGRIMISYSPSIVDDPCTTCNHDGFSFVFDSNSRRLLKE